LHHDGKPFAGRRVLLFARVSDIEPHADGLAYATQAWWGEAVTDAAGRATWHDFPNGAGELRLVPVARPGEDLPALVALRGMSGQEVALEHPARVQLRLRDGKQALVPGARVVLMPCPDDLSVLDGYGCEPQAVTDNTGTVEFRVPAGKYWLLACTELGFAHGRVVVVAAEDAPTLIELTLTDFSVWDVRVQAGEQPVAGAWMDGTTTSWLDGAPIPEPDLLLPSQWLNARNVDLVSAGSADADGRLRVRTMPTGNGYVSGVVRGPAGSSRTSRPVDLRGSSLPSRVTLR
jgi:hypothetical protein